MSEITSPRCGKIIYPNAHIAHLTMQEKKKYLDVRLNYYYCEICVGYHLTKLRPKQQEAFRLLLKLSWETRQRVGEFAPKVGGEE
jgi:predicted nucleic-acid-binding Zn-ribbon protein